LPQASTFVIWQWPFAGGTVGLARLVSFGASTSFLIQLQRTMLLFRLALNLCQIIPILPAFPASNEVTPRYVQYAHLWRITRRLPAHTSLVMAL